MILVDWGRKNSKFVSDAIVGFVTSSQELEFAGLHLSKRKGAPNILDSCTSPAKSTLKFSMLAQS